MNDLDAEWLEALGDEALPTKDEEDVDGVNSEDTDSDNTDIPDGNTDDAPKEDPQAEEEEDGKTQEREAPEEDTSPEEDPTKRAIKEALQEIETDRSSRLNQVEAVKKEAMEKLYPNGVDRQLRDSDGDPITGIDDLTKLINPKTNDYFTEEEAGRWLLENQQRLNREVEQVERYVEKVAEVNVNLTEGAKRVHDKYADILKDEPTRRRILGAYERTLVRDPETNVVINAPVDIEEFFDIALESRVAPPPEPAPKPKPAPTERGDFKPKGQPNQMNQEDKEWALAYKEYEEGL